MAITPASIRTNNPGAMYPGPAATKFGSTQYQTLRSKDGEHRIAMFDDPVRGGAAMFYLLGSKSYTGRTIEQAIAKWCGGFYVSTYIRVLEQQGGVSRKDVLTRDLVLDPEVAIPLAKAMAWQEAGREYPMTDAQWRQAHALAFGLQAPQPIPPLPVPKPDVMIAEAPPLEAAPQPEPEPMEDIPTVVAVEAPAGPLRKSGTIWGAIGAAAGVAVQWMDSTVRLMVDWTAQLVAIQPVEAALAAMGANSKALGAGLAIGSLCLVVTRRVRAKLEGKRG